MVESCQPWAKKVYFNVWSMGPWRGRRKVRICGSLEKPSQKVVHRAHGPGSCKACLRKGKKKGHGAGVRESLTLASAGGRKVGKVNKQGHGGKKQEERRTDDVPAMSRQCCTNKKGSPS